MRVTGLGFSSANINLHVQMMLALLIDDTGPLRTSSHMSGENTGG